MFRTEHEFTLPLGLLDADGTLHREGTMRLATAADEILPLRDPRVQRNPAYLTVILLSRVITALGTLESSRRRRSRGCSQPISRTSSGSTTRSTGSTAGEVTCPAVRAQLRHGGRAPGGVLAYPVDRMMEELAFVAYHFHWSHDDVVELEHADRRAWVARISDINERIGRGVRTLRPLDAFAARLRERHARRRAWTPPLGRGAAPRGPAAGAADGACRRPRRWSTWPWRSRCSSPAGAAAPRVVTRAPATVVAAPVVAAARLAAAARTERVVQALTVVRHVHTPVAADRARRAGAGRGRAAGRRRARAAHRAGRRRRSRRSRRTFAAPLVVARPPAVVAPTVESRRRLRRRAALPAPSRAADRRRANRRLGDRRAGPPDRRRPRALRSPLMAALEKATITNTVTGARIPVLFNPEEYTLKRDINYAQARSPGCRRPILQFVAGNLQTLEMELLLDTYEQHVEGGRVLNDAGSDVRDLTDKVSEPDGHRPDDARAAGAAVHVGLADVHAACSRARTQQFLMFLPDGTPVRARLQVTFNEYRNVELEAQEIKRETADYTKRHVVGQGETLSSIAAAAYGDPALWRPIASRNEIDVPAAVAVGTALVVPALPYTDPDSGEVFGSHDQPALRPGARGRARRAADPRPRCAPRSRGSRCSSRSAPRTGPSSALANERLRWLDHALLRSTRGSTVAIGYAPDRPEQLFAGEVVAHDATFPASGAPTLTVVGAGPVAAPAGGQRRRGGSRSRSPTVGNFPLPDAAIVDIVALEHGLVGLLEPVGAAISALLGGAARGRGRQRHARRCSRSSAARSGESDFDFLSAVARENGWELTIDQSGPLAGLQLRFLSPLDHLAPDVTLTYGASLIDFRPRISTVGQIVSVTACVWVAQIKTSLRHHRRLGLGPDGAEHRRPAVVLAHVQSGPSDVTVERAGDAARRAAQAARRADPQAQPAAHRVGQLRRRPADHRRLGAAGSTASASQFGGLYRVTSATHTLDQSGYRTTFELRKEIWFGSIPAAPAGRDPDHAVGAVLRRSADDLDSTSCRSCAARATRASQASRSASWSDNLDAMGHGRVQVRLPGLPVDPPWARVAVPDAGSRARDVVHARRSTTRCSSPSSTAT